MCVWVHANECVCVSVCVCSCVHKIATQTYSTTYCILELHTIQFANNKSPQPNHNCSLISNKWKVNNYFYTSSFIARYWSHSTTVLKSQYEVTVPQYWSHSTEVTVPQYWSHSTAVLKSQYRSTEVTVPQYWSHSTAVLKSQYHSTEVTVPQYWSRPHSDKC